MVPERFATRIGSLAGTGHAVSLAASAVMLSYLSGVYDYQEYSLAWSCCKYTSYAIMKGRHDRLTEFCVQDSCVR